MGLTRPARLRVRSDLVSSNAEWEFQASTGHLVDPEQLEPGKIERSTASVSWTSKNAGDISSVTAGYGQNDTDHGTRRAVFVEGSRHVGSNTLYGRFEGVQARDRPAANGPGRRRTGRRCERSRSGLHAGRSATSCRSAGFDGGIGADVTVYGVPDALQPIYSAAPVSFHVFFRLRPPARIDGTHVEHADVAADGGSSDGGDVNSEGNHFSGKGRRYENSHGHRRDRRGISSRRVGGRANADRSHQRRHVRVDDKAMSTVLSDRDCASACTAKGAQYVLISNGKTYKLHESCGRFEDTRGTHREPHGRREGRHHRRLGIEMPAGGK